jgi:hypothetical protein
MQIQQIHNYVSTFWDRFASSTLCELVALVGDRIPFPDIDPRQRDRIFNPWRTFWLFLGQILSATQACQEALKKAQMWLSLPALSALSALSASGKKKHLLYFRYLRYLRYLPSYVRLL